jgi:ESS family glutamate:Na+ symporter
VLQNLLGIALARLFGLNPFIGIISGSVALTGGPATALAFGRTFEDLGIAGASTLGIAAATFGITAGVPGGHIGGWLISRHRLFVWPGSRRTPASIPADRTPRAPG